jgi:two-component system, NarL family, sensor kinase
VKSFIQIIISCILSSSGVFVAAQSPASLNDSASFFLDRSKPEKAKRLLEKNLSDAKGLDLIRTKFLLGEVHEFQGYSVKALRAFHEVQRLANKTKDVAMSASIHNGIAGALINLGNYDSVLWHLEKAATYDSSGYNGVTNILTRARYWQAKNQPANALKYYQAAERKAIDLNLRKEQAIALSGMASALFSQDPGMQRVLRYLKEANAIADSILHPNIIARNYVRMANASMVLSNTLDAAVYLDKAKKIIDLTNNLPVKSYLLASLSILKSEQGDIKSALEYALEPAKIKRELEQPKQLQNDLLNISEYQMSLKQYNDAYKTITEGIQVSSSINDYVYLHYFHDRFARLDTITGNYKSAYFHLLQSMAFKDSTVSFQRMHAVDELQEKYEAEKREKVIAEKELVIEHQKFTMALVSGAAIMVLLISAFIFLVIRNQHNLRLQKEKELQHYLRLQTIVNTQEEVQQSIARDIHDGLVQLMGAAKLSLASIPSGSVASAFPSISKASQIIDEACVEARQISHQLLPYSLLKDGLVSAMEDLLEKSFSDYEFIKNTTLANFPPEKAIHIYRIAQEIINNVIKHAEADKMIVEVSEQDGSLIITFRDNGKGFSPDTIQRGAGLLNIQTRAELIGAKLNTESIPGKGTSFTLTVSHV